jgi:uncharacterized protein YndB with AHSA1/START domain
MTSPSNDQFVYVTYIKTTAERLWQALTTAAFIQQYWFGMHCECDWQVGSSWRLLFADGRVADTGEVVQSDAPKRLEIKWRNEFREELKAEGYSYCSFAIETVGDAVKLTVTHSIDHPESKLIVAVSGGWPKVLSNLKSLLETGSIAVTT